MQDLIHKYAEKGNKNLVLFNRKKKGGFKVKGLRIVAEINKTLNQIENSRQAIIKNNDRLTLDDQRVLFKVNGHLKRIQKDLYEYQVEKIKC